MVSEDTKQAMIQSTLTRKELDLLANTLKLPINPQDLQNQEIRCSSCWNTYEDSRFK